MPASPIHLLLVEDNPGDVRLAKETLRESRLQNTMDVVSDGEQALDYLRHTAQYSACPRPDMVLLDMNLPKLDGFEVLEEIRRDPDLSSIPIVVLVASKADEALIRKYRLPEECFVEKPLTLERFLDAARCFSDIGVTLVKIATA